MIQELLNEQTTYILNLYKEAGVVLGMVLPFLESLFPFLPLSAFVVLNVVAFGTVGGFFISWFGSIIGCWVLYWGIRLVCRHPFIEKWTNHHYYHKMHTCFKKNEAFYTILAYSVPVLPNFLMTIIASVNKMNFIKYAIYSGLGSGIYFFVLSGGISSLGTILVSPSKCIAFVIVGIGYMYVSKKFSL